MQKNKHKLHYKKIAAFFTSLLFVIYSGYIVSAKTLSEQQDSDYGTPIDFSYKVTEDYASKEQEYEKHNYLSENSKEIIINANSFIGNNFKLKNDNESVLWDEQNENISCKFDCENDGLYFLNITYKSVENTNGNIKRSINIDNKTPFDECSNITLYRLWKDDGEPRINSAGDEIRPNVQEIFDWQTVSVVDNSQMYAEGLKFELKKGEHSLKLGFISGEMYLKSISFVPVSNLKSYKEVSASYNKNEIKNAENIRFEAESTKYLESKSSSVLRMDSDGDPATTPFEYGHSKMNVFGGQTWSIGGATWKFNVEKSGYYCLGMRIKQNYRDGLPSYRRIKIDGSIPFSEFQEYRFLNNKNWYYTVLGENDEKPYYIYLTSGQHTLSMEAVQGKCKDIYRIIKSDSLVLSNFVLNITMLTGKTVDSNYDYEIEKYIPDTIDILTNLTDNMKNMMKIMKDISCGEPAKYYQLKSMIAQLNNMIKDTFIIPTHIDELDNILSSYGIWMEEMKNQPLMIDYITLSEDSDNNGNKNSTVFQNIYAGITNFIMTFFKDYNNSSGVVDLSDNSNQTLNVWVARGTKWSDLIKQMSDEDFTPKSGIEISVNTLPAGQLNSGSANALLLAISSGRAPDISMGTANTSVGEFAMRNATADLTKFDDFEIIKKRFIDKLFVSLSYNGGVYGLPETMNFKAIMYRKDILSQIGVRLPSTWQELKDYVIPVLYRNNMNFYIGTTEYNTFLYQYGGKYYTDDLKYSGLGSAKAYTAFKEYTDLFTLYGVPVSESFFNRFRSGESPIGIVDFALYMQIAAAAPELSGKWAISPIPGVKNADGSINNSNTGIAAESVMIMSQSKNKPAAWEYLKWWTSDETQIKFGSEIESLIGETARWNSANVNAFKGMAWDKSDIDVIMKTFDNVNQIPVVLGGYFTDRHITNAFNRTVVSGIGPMTSLENAVKDINRELKRRRD